jgi:putative Mg2+ transporter-C (MgtC) family protein
MISEFTGDVVSLGVAILLGGLLGVERQFHGHWAGMRTHMMVAMGAAIFVIAGGKIGDGDEATRVVQGVATGVGFLGAGTILKLSTQIEIKGLTTASSIWLSAALGTVAGLRQYTLAAAAACVSLVVLAVLRPFKDIGSPNRNEAPPPGNVPGSSPQNMEDQW